MGNVYTSPSTSMSPTPPPPHGAHPLFTMDKRSMPTPLDEHGRDPCLSLLLSIEDAMSRHSVEHLAGGQKPVRSPSLSLQVTRACVHGVAPSLSHVATAPLDQPAAAATPHLHAQTRCTVHRPSLYKMAQAPSAQTHSPPEHPPTTSSPPQWRGAPLLPTLRERA
jgi:hypothetical protein